MGLVRALTVARTCMVLLSLAAAGCQSSRALGDAGEAAAPADGLASADAGEDKGTCGDPYGDSSMPFDPCAVDSDCHNPFLVCAPPLATTTVCREADAAVNDDCPLPGSLADIPICPEMAQVTFSVCDVRYQRPCTVAADCGPTGFTCASGRCDQQTSATCTAPSECPTGWTCYEACGCLGQPKHCYPPFARVNCPICAPVDGG